ncbi:hypothetical protein N0V91_011052 [Didymella pomorum]|uniref:Uncharacterized protein n=1 Tax=Didymella pomorum TaxID=749634 RepID=A0A9W8YY66_9PLEO|nr:hypothetical protein N0V91_011052 [Didymella pomorum]
MPSIKSAKVRAVVTRSAPYPASKPTNNTANRENALPLDSASPAATPLPASKDKPAAKKTAAKKTSAPKKDTATRVRLDLPDSYLDIELEEAAAVIRRKLNALLDKKVYIPGSNTVFNKTNLSKELCKIAEDHPTIESSAGTRSKGPSAHAITIFLKKSGNMSGGDSQTFYYGTMLLEKLRIWNGEKKSKAREEAEDR